MMASTSATDSEHYNAIHPMLMSQKVCACSLMAVLHMLPSSQELLSADVLNHFKSTQPVVVHASPSALAASQTPKKVFDPAL